MVVGAFRCPWGISFRRDAASRQPRFTSEAIPSETRVTQCVQRLEVNNRLWARRFIEGSNTRAPSLTLEEPTLGDNEK